MVEDVEQAESLSAFAVDGGPLPVRRLVSRYRDRPNVGALEGPPSNRRQVPAQALETAEIMSVPTSDRESGNRDGFLAKVAARSNLPTTDHLIAADDEAAGGLEYATDLSDPVAAFTAGAEGHGSTVYLVRNDADHLAAVLDIASTFDIDRVLHLR